jgi:hypothetical protein
MENKLERNYHLPAVSYEYETWSLTLIDLHRLKLFEKRELGRIFGQKREEVTERCKKS